MKRINAVYALLLNDEKNKVLMVCNKDNNDSWTLPGGAVEDNETLEQAIIREVEEETGLTVKIKDVVSINERFFEDSAHVIFFTFNATIIGGDIKIRFVEEISEVRWMDIDEADSYMPYHKGGIKKLLQSSAPYYFQD